MSHMSRRRSESVRLNVAPDGWLQGQWSRGREQLPFAVVFLHGFCSVRYGEKAQALEECCARRGWTFATFDFRGHGESSGKVRELRGSTLLADLDTIYVFLNSHGVQQLCLFGSSMGGWAASWYALRRPGRVAATALVAPGFHFLSARWDKLTPVEQAEWQRTGILRIQSPWINAELGYGLIEERPLFAPDDMLRELRTPTLIFQGMRDEVVPAARTIAWVESCQNPQLELRLYKDGDHRLTDRKQEMAEAACEHFARFVSSKS
jgi:pimeloyl-ACP methyl ester carboxylesterase